MEIQNNDDFKYVLQDTNTIYFGRELTYAEMMDREDVPFKFKAVLSAHIARDTDLDKKNGRASYDNLRQRVFLPHL